MAVIIVSWKVPSQTNGAFLGRYSSCLDLHGLSLMSLLIRIDISFCLDFGLTSCSSWTSVTRPRCHFQLSSCSFS